MLFPGTSHHYLKKSICIKGFVYFPNLEHMKCCSLLKGTTNGCLDDLKDLACSNAHFVQEVSTYRGLSIHKTEYNVNQYII